MTFGFEGGRRKPGKGFNSCTSTTIENPKEESKPSEADTSTVGQDQ